MEILEREISRTVMIDEKEEVEVKKLGDIIDPEQDVWEIQGNQIIKHTGILKLAEYVGATWDVPRLEDTPNNYNNRGFYYMITCRFPDGSCSFESGEASEATTKNPYKQSVAIKRGMDRSFLRSSYMKMYDIYSEEEADAFKQEKPAVDSEEVEKLLEKQKRYNDMIAQLKNIVALPDEDDEYPKAYVVEVWDIHQDKEYLKKLCTHENNAIRWVAQQKLKEVETAEKEKEEKQTA